jgi:hypothetical protein
MELKRPNRIEYPITVNAIEYERSEAIEPPLGKKAGSWVRVRPCADEYEDKTFLGILIGEVPLAQGVSFNQETGTLTVSKSMYNPAILIPSLGKIVYGAGSWWGLIRTPGDLKTITDDTIDNVWYVQALKQLDQADAQRAGNGAGNDA